MSTKIAKMNSTQKFVDLQYMAIINNKYVNSQMSFLVAT